MKTPPDPKAAGAARPLDRARWQRVSALLDGVLERPAEARPGYLDGACGGDLELRREIARLAYELYLRHGRVPGHDVEDWLTAEALIHSRLARREKPVGDHIDGKEAE